MERALGRRELITGGAAAVGGLVLAAAIPPNTANAWAGACVAELDWYYLGGSRIRSSLHGAGWSVGDIHWDYNIWCEGSWIFAAGNIKYAATSFSHSENHWGWNAGYYYMLGQAWSTSGVTAGPYSDDDTL